VALPLCVGKKVLDVVELFFPGTPCSCPSHPGLFVCLGRPNGSFSGAALGPARAWRPANAQFLLVEEAASLAVFTIDEQSTILFANPFVEQLFGYSPGELIGQNLTLVMPEYLHHVHECGLAQYVATGQRHVSWDGIPLPGLHKNGHEISLIISFGEFVRGGKRVFTGFAKLRALEPR
jgi:PAS domain S-box-containing protein